MPQRYMSTSITYSRPEWTARQPTPARHFDGEPKRSERMTGQDVAALIQHAASNPQFWEAFDFVTVPGIEVIHYPLSNPNSVEVIRILGLTINDLPIDLFSGGY